MSQLNVILLSCGLLNVQMTLRQLTTSARTQKMYVIPSHLLRINPFRPIFAIVIFIHYKRRIAVAILDL